jgi:uncharacterized protein YdeI (YjbR/CyaY-like superfamily)
MLEKIPKELKDALHANSIAWSIWTKLTGIAHRDFIRWIESAKQLKTREHRIARTCQMLIEGKRRPCCYSVVPMNLYKALSENERAKTTWKSLNGIEKRDLIDFLDKSKDAKDSMKRIEKVSLLLVRGKRKI